MRDLAFKVTDERNDVRYILSMPNSDCALWAMLGALPDKAQIDYEKVNAFLMPTQTGSVSFERMIGLSSMFPITDNWNSCSRTYYTVMIHQGHAYLTWYNHPTKWSPRIFTLYYDTFIQPRYSNLPTAADDLAWAMTAGVEVIGFGRGFINGWDG